MRVLAIGWLASVCACLALGGRAAAQPAPSAHDASEVGSSGRVIHLRVIGDLDNAKVAQDVVAELSRAKSEKTAIVVLELESEHSRPDVVWSIGQAVKEAGVPVAAFLHEGSGGTLDAGTLEVGLLARECSVRGRPMVKEAAGDGLKWSAPSETSWERVERELTGSLWVSLKDHGTDPALATVLVARRPSAWCVPGASASDRWTLAMSEPGQASGVMVSQVVFAADSGPGRLELTADEIAGFGAAKIGITNVGQVIASCAPGSGVRVSRTVTSGLAAARTRASADADAAKTAATRATELLDVKKRLHRKNLTVADYHEAAKDAIVEIEKGAAEIKAADAEIAAYPEVLRRKPEPHDSAASKRRTKPAEDPISTELSTAEKDLEKLRARAEDYQRRK